MYRHSTFWPLGLTRTRRAISGANAVLRRLRALDGQEGVSEAGKFGGVDGGVENAWRSLTHPSVIISSRTDGLRALTDPPPAPNQPNDDPPAPARRPLHRHMVQHGRGGRRSEPLPTELNTIDHPRFLAVSKDKLTVRVGRGNHSQDVGAVRTEWPCPQRCLVYYFEVTVADSARVARSPSAWRTSTSSSTGSPGGSRTRMHVRARYRSLRVAPRAHFLSP